MAAKTDWVENIKDGAVGNDLSTNNKSGFSALPGGCRLEDGRFYYKSYKGMWWITPESVVADVRCLLNDFEFLGWEDSYNNLGVSVRLLRD